MVEVTRLSLFADKGWFISGIADQMQSAQTGSPEWFWCSVFQIYGKVWTEGISITDKKMENNTAKLLFFVIDVKA